MTETKRTFNCEAAVSEAQRLYYSMLMRKRILSQIDANVIMLHLSGDRGRVEGFVSLQK